MKLSPRMTIAAAVLAIAATGAASAAADTLYSTIPSLVGVADPSLALPDAGECNSNTGCGSWTVYDVFTLSQGATVSGFSFYSYFFTASSADYIGANWSIWGSLGSGGDVAPDSSAAIAFGTASGAGVNLVLDPGSGPSLVTVSGLDQHLDAGTYYIGLQNEFSSAADYSYYATANSNYPVVGDIPSTAYFSQTNQVVVSAATGGGPSIVGPSIGGFSQVAFRIDGVSDSGGGIAPGVPEPATWVMTFIGFAGLGWLATRRFPRRQVR